MIFTRARRVAPALLVLTAAFSLSLSAARAQNARPTGPFLTYDGDFGTSASGGTETVTLRLNGFTNDPAAPGSPEYISDTLYSFYEKSFEQGGGVVVTGVDITGDGFSWTLHPDVGFSTPNRPVIPLDPRVFRLTTVPNASNQHLYTQTFYFYNYDNETGLLFLDEAPPLGGIVNGQLTDPTKNRGPIAFGVPCLTGQVCGGTIRTPAARGPAAVPEPGSLAALGIGAGILGASLKRRRRAR